MAPRITLEGLEHGPVPPPVARAGAAPQSSVEPAPLPTVRRIRTGPGEFTFGALLWAGLGFYSITQGFAQDRSQLVLIAAVSFAVLAIGVVWPMVALRSVTTTATTPSDVQCGGRFSVGVSVAGRTRAVLLRVVDFQSSWVHCDAPDVGSIPVVAPHRGVHQSVLVELTCGGPLNVFVRHKVVSCRLAAPLYIGPVPIHVAAHTQPVSDAAITAANQMPQTSDVVRSTRPYVAGDPVRSVHWPTTARTGHLVVREFEPPTQLGLAIIVDLRGGDSRSVEASVSQAAGAAHSVLATGGRCLLVTANPRASATVVNSLLSVQRTLAAASRQDPGPAPTGWPILVIAS